MHDSNESVADAMNRAFFLAPDLVGEGEDDPLLQQAVQNVKDDVEASRAREATQAVLDAQKTAEAAPPRAPAPSARGELCEIIPSLIGIIGRRYTAVIGDAAGTGVIAEWLRGTAIPGDERLARLRLAYRAVQTLRPRFDNAAVREWFLTENERLGGERPIALVAFQPASSIEERFLAAASAISPREGE